MKPHRVFLDAGIYIAGAASATGGSRQILDWCALGLLKPVTSYQVLDETRRNVAKKLPRATQILEKIISLVNAEIIPEPTEEVISQASLFVPIKDAPILAAAIQANVDYFVTLDRRHFKPPAVQQAVSFPILLPEEFIPIVRLELARENENRHMT
ncbi:MAG: PIN domain-containing protein [Fimbriimonadia bacterium]|nr:PIN domain-containing protein [Fimbriimonadia bacterium]